MSKEREQSLGCYYCYYNAGCICPLLMPDCEDCLMYPGNYYHLLGGCNGEKELNPGYSEEIENG